MVKRRRMAATNWPPGLGLGVLLVWWVALHP